MKKASLALLFLCAGLGVFAQSGVILEATGVVEIKSPGDEIFVAAKIGDQLSQGTVISTGFKSFVTIEIGCAFITVKPLSRLTLTEAQSSAEEETLDVDLLAGRVHVDVKPPAGAKALMSVMSPMAVVSVRGTSFEFDTRNIYVDDGVVGFTGKHGPLMRVGAGANSRVKANAGAANPLERKTAGLFLTPLPGMDVIGGPVRVGVPFTIGLNFFHE
jgi:hypothetical protein